VKNFKLKSTDIVRLISPMGGASATDKIVVDGMTIGYMHRENPINEMDSGWRFFSGMEDQDYIDNNHNTGIYDVNTIANYDPAIIQYLDMPIGSELERISNTNKFQLVNE
jgi:hypothetical protein